MTTQFDRFMAKISPEPNTGCWLWTAATDRDGYARFQFDGQWGMAHRFAYESLVGHVPAGLTLDHLCRVRSCVNPAHLEPCTLGENTRRSPQTFQGINAAKTKCIHGHEFTPENTLVAIRRWRVRECRACGSERQRRYQANRERRQP